MESVGRDEGRAPAATSQERGNHAGHLEDAQHRAFAHRGAVAPRHQRMRSARDARVRPATRARARSSSRSLVKDVSDSSRVAEVSDVAEGRAYGDQIAVDESRVLARSVRAHRFHRRIAGSSPRIIEGLHRPGAEAGAVVRSPQRRLRRQRLSRSYAVSETPPSASIAPAQGVSCTTGSSPPSTSKPPAELGDELPARVLDLVVGIGVREEAGIAERSPPARIAVRRRHQESAVVAGAPGGSREARPRADECAR